MAGEAYEKVNDRDWCNYADSLEEEGTLRRDETPLRDAEINMRFLRGDQHSVDRSTGSPFRANNATYRFTLNLMASLMKRKVALITDSRPQIDVVPSGDKNKQGAANVLKETILGLWEEMSFDQLAARELVRAGTIGSSVCVPIWDHTARFGRGDIAFLMVDPRFVVIDPSVTRAVDLQRTGEFFMMKEVVPLNQACEAYPIRADELKPDSKWSEYVEPKSPSSVVAGGFKSIASAVQRPWRREQQELKKSQMPRVELRHTWFRDWQRDANGKPIFRRPRFLRYVVDASRVVIKDEVMPYWHKQLPGHILDWDIELEHPWGMPEIGGLRRIQYTLNRIVGQVMENIITTNKVRMTGDTDAVDPKTWDLLASNPNWMAIRKRMGRQLNIEMPENAIPANVMAIVQFLVQAVDLASGMTDAAQGRVTKNLSGFALEGLQMAAQSIVRLEARAFENWLERIFRQVVALIFEYMQADRTFAYSGPGKDLIVYNYERANLLKTDQQKSFDQETEWRDFTFRILPGSSLTMSRVQRGVMASNLYQLGLLPGVEVLRAAEWPKPDETFQVAQQEFAARSAAQMASKERLQKQPGTTRRSVAGV